MKEFDNLWVIDRGLMKGLDNLGTIVKAFRNLRIVVKGFGEKNWIALRPYQVKGCDERI
jgi:hypothetical protein